jgi:predicted GIY-YIG superfamily endonuclease
MNTNKGVYVVELNNGCYYVGQSSNIKNVFVYIKKEEGLHLLKILEGLKYIETYYC